MNGQISSDPETSGLTEVFTRYGTVHLIWRDEELSKVCPGAFDADPDRRPGIGGYEPSNENGRRLIAQVLSYFEGEPVDIECSFPERSGSGFQRAVWTALKGIPYGKVETYGGLARRAGLSLRNARPVGNACGRNPLPILVPCHRVVASTGLLTGYSAGTAWKKALLELEGIRIEHGRIRI